MRKISVYWSLPLGLLCAAAQIVAFYVRFGRWNTDAAFADYLSFFVAGTFGGWILIYFLNKGTTSRQRWMVLAAFLLASPFAMLLMLAGGLLGWPGVLVLPLIPWALFTWAGSLAGRLIQ